MLKGRKQDVSAMEWYLKEREISRLELEVYQAEEKKEGRAKSTRRDSYFTRENKSETYGEGRRESKTKRGGR